MKKHEKETWISFHFCVVVFFFRSAFASLPFHFGFLNNNLFSYQFNETAQTRATNTLAHFSSALNHFAPHTRQIQRIALNGFRVQMQTVNSWTYGRCLLCFVLWLWPPFIYNTLRKSCAFASKIIKRSLMRIEKWVHTECTARSLKYMYRMQNGLQ